MLQNEINYFDGGGLGKDFSLGLELKNRVSLIVCWALLDLHSVMYYGQTAAVSRPPNLH